MTDHTTHDLAIARAERDAWQSTCEELHRTIAGRDVEIEAHLGRCEAADQRARSLEAGLAHVNGNIMECRAELRAIRDLVAPGNPQGTVVDAVRARLDAVENAQAFGIRERDAAIARAEKAESDLSELTAARDRLLAREHEDGRLHAQLRVELAELRARPVLTEDLLRGALDAHGHAALTRKLFAHLGPVMLPAQDRAEELVSAWRGICTDTATCDLDPAERMRRALASLGAPPTSPPAARPVFAGVSEDELIRLFYVVGTDGIDHGEQCPPIDISDRNGIRAVLARLEVSLVTPVAPTLVAVSDEELAREHEDGRLHAQLRAEVAELRARPVLTEDLLRGALDAHGHAALTRKLFAHLGPVTLPSPDRAEELTAAIYDAVERAERAMTPGPWAAKIYTTHVAGTSQETQWHEAISDGGAVVCETECSAFEDESAIGAVNIAGIVAIRNAAPALIAEVRALRAAAELERSPAPAGPGPVCRLCHGDRDRCGHFVGGGAG